MIIIGDFSLADIYSYCSRAHNNSVVIVETAPSFEQISQSITDLLMDSAVDESAVAESSAEMSASAALSSEYQQISTWCWVNIRVRRDALSVVHM